MWCVGLTCSLKLRRQIFEGRLLQYDQTRGIVLIELFAGRIVPFHGKQIRAIMPRNAGAPGDRRKVECCRYFVDTGKCAFGPLCRKEHDARMLTLSAQNSLRVDPEANQRQQLTLHLAHLPVGYDEDAVSRVRVARTPAVSETLPHRRSLTGLLQIRQAPVGEPLREKKSCR